jgi:hypothetical protein
MSTAREEREAELRQLITTQEGQKRLRELYEEITGERLPGIVHLYSLFPAILERHVQDTEVAMILKEFLPAPDAITSLRPEEVGERLLFFFEDSIHREQKNAIKRDYIGGRYPVKDYPVHLQTSISKVLLEGWDWLASKGMIVKENKGDSFVISRSGEEYLERVKEKQGRFVIFYSWQSDLPSSRNLGFIQECIEEAIAALSAEKIQLIPCLDRDTQGEPGAPDIAETILAKIDNCDMFVADASIISGSGAPRATPNPNVMLELGYAAKRLGWERITTVFNLAYGKIEELPFDLRKRRVVDYSLQPEESKTSAKKGLVKAFALQIKACIEMGKVVS